MKQIFKLIIRFYQYFISPWFGKNCKFHPTCSEYAYESIENIGIIKGAYYTIKRLFKCHPFSQADYYDPAPKKPK